MNIKLIKGLPYLYSSHRINGKVVQTYMGRATPEWVEIIKAVQNEAAENVAAEAQAQPAAGGGAPETPGLCC